MNAKSLSILLFTLVKTKRHYKVVTRYKVRLNTLD